MTDTESDRWWTRCENIVRSTLPDNIQTYVETELGDDAHDFMEQIAPKSRYIPQRCLQALIEAMPQLLPAVICAYETHFERKLPQLHESLIPGLVQILWSDYLIDKSLTPEDVAQVEATIAAYAFHQMSDEQQHNPDRDMPAVAINAGLLIDSDGTLDFAHRFIREYYAAIYIEHHDVLDQLSLIRRPNIGRSHTKWDEPLLLWCLLQDTDHRLLQIAERDPLLPIQLIQDGLIVSLPVRLKCLTIAVETLDYRDVYNEWFFSPNRWQIVHRVINADHDLTVLTQHLDSTDPHVVLGALYTYTVFPAPESVVRSTVIEKLKHTDLDAVFRGPYAEVLALYIADQHGCDSLYAVGKVPFSTFDPTVQTLLSGPINVEKFLLFVDLRPSWGHSLRSTLLIFAEFAECRTDNFCIVHDPLSGYILARWFNPVYTHVISHSDTWDFYDLKMGIRALEMPGVVHSEGLSDPEELVSIFKRANSII